MSLLTELRDCGYMLELLPGSKLHILPTPEPELLEWIRGYKEELVAALRSDPLHIARFEAPEQFNNLVLPVSAEVAAAVNANLYTYTPERQSQWWLSLAQWLGTDPAPEQCITFEILSDGYDQVQQP
jgi:hypothetical protein